MIVYFISNSNSKNENIRVQLSDDKCDLAMEDLRIRYAKGEISRDTHLEVNMDLERDCTPS